MIRKRTAKLLTSEIERFEALAVIKWDEKQPLDARCKAVAELLQWTDGKSEKDPEHVVKALLYIEENKAKPIEVRCEANLALLRLTHEKPPEIVCSVLRGLPSDVAVCANCGKGVGDEAHGGGDYPGLYCRTCCPGCSLIPREQLEEVPAEIDPEPIAREIVLIVRRDHWNSSGVN